MTELHLEAGREAVESFTKHIFFELFELNLEG